MPARETTANDTVRQDVDYSAIRNAIIENTNMYLQGRTQGRSATEQFNRVMDHIINGDGYTIDNIPETTNALQGLNLGDIIEENRDDTTALEYIIEAGRLKDSTTIEELRCCNYACERKATKLVDEDVMRGHIHSSSIRIAVPSCTECEKYIRDNIYDVDFLEEIISNINDMLKDKINTAK